MITAALALIISILSVFCLLLSSAIQDTVSQKASSTLIIGGYIGTGLGLILGLTSVPSLPGVLAVVTSAASAGMCGTAYFRYRTSVQKNYLISSEPIEILPPKDDREKEYPPSELDTDDGSEPSPGPVPVETETEEQLTCTLKHISGYTFLHVVLRGGDWRKRFNCEFFIYPRDKRIDFYIIGTGTVNWGLFDADYEIHLAQDEYYIALECIDQCTKLLLDSWGTPKVTDGPLAAGFSVTKPSSGSSDTVTIDISVVASMDSNVSLATNIPNAPSLSITEGPTQMESRVGSNVYKCVKA